MGLLTAAISLIGFLLCSKEKKRKEEEEVEVNMTQRNYISALEA